MDANIRMNSTGTSRKILIKILCRHRGLVGSAIWENLIQRGYTNLVGRTHKELDLLDPVAVRTFFDEECPDAVVLAAAHVGGIMANLQYRADFIYQNLQIQQNVYFC